MPADDTIAVVRLERRHDRESFRCGEPELDEFLRSYARQGARKDLTQTWVAVRSDGTAISGYYSLRMGEVACALLPESERRRLPRYPVPVVHLARLAVDERERGKGLGELLLLDALDRAAMLSEQIGAAAVEVLAKSERASAFYARYGFACLFDDDRHMYLSMRAVRRALGRT